MEAAQYIGIVIAAVFGTGGVVAFFKLRGENTRVLVSAAEGAVVVQTSVITTLQNQAKQREEDINDLRIQVAELKKEVTQNKLDHEEFDILRRAFDAMTRDRDKWRDRAKDLGYSE